MKIKIKIKIKIRIKVDVDVDVDINIRRLIIRELIRIRKMIEIGIKIRIM